MAIKKVISETFHALLAHWLSSGILLAMSAAIPYWAYVTEHWSWPFAVSVGIVLLASLLTIYRGFFDRQVDMKTPTHLSLQFNALPNLPLMLNQTNVWRWYAFYTGWKLIDPDTKEYINLPVQWTVFVVFDKPIAIKQLRIDSGGAPLPEYEIKDSSNRHAVIYFGGPLSGMVIDFQWAL